MEKHVTTPNYSDLRDSSKRIDLVEMSPISCPMTIYLEATNICNFKCKYCPESFDDYENITGGFHRMSTAEFEMICDQVNEMGQLKTLNFYMMGEPFVNKNLPEFIKIAKSKKISEKLIVTTNGSLLDAETAQKVIDSELDYIRFSIYGTDQDDFSKTTGSKLNIERIIDRIRYFRKLRDEQGKTKPFLYAKMIDTLDDNRNQNFLNLFRDICEEAAIEPVMNWNDPSEGNLSGLETSVLLEKPYFSKRKEVCPFPFYTLVIHSDLSVSVCCVDWAKKTVVGNLKEQSLKEIWMGERLKEFRLTHLRRERHSLEACRACTFLHTAPDSLDELSPDTFSARY
jgi:MoaA/NifB/PqqE/SkfB family radical SAM enzyme